MKLELKILLIFMIILIFSLSFILLVVSEYFDNTHVPAYIIALDDTKYNQALKLLKNTNLNFKKYDAIRGASVNLDNITTIKAKYDVLIAKNRRSHAELGTLGAIGCYLSHINLWKKIIDENLDGMYIFESDAVFTKPELINSSVQEFLKQDNPHILFFGVCNIYSKKLTKIQQRFYCTHAYYITHEGAKFCLKYALPIDEQIDSYLSDLMFLYNLNFYNISIAKQANIDRTTIQLKSIKCDK